MNGSNNKPPILPTETWHHILSFLGRKDLLTIRLVWPQYDNFIIKHLELTDVMISIESREDMTKFLEMVQYNIQATELRFTYFNLNIQNISLSSLETFLKNIGEDIRQLYLETTLEFENTSCDDILISSKINACLHAALNLEVLTISKEDKILPCFEEYPPLEKLKKLDIDITEASNCLKELHLNSLCKWLRQMPKLLILNCDFGILKIDTDANLEVLQEIPEINFVHNIDAWDMPLLQRYSQVPINLTSLSLGFWDDDDWKPLFHNDFVNTFKLLLISQSDTLRELNLRQSCDAPIQFPLMKRLEKLNLESYRAGIEEDALIHLSSRDFPRLLELVVYLERIKILDEFNQVTKVQFPSVEAINAYRNKFPNANQICVRSGVLEALELLQFPSVDKFELVLDFCFTPVREVVPENNAKKNWNYITNCSKLEIESPFYIPNVNGVNIENDPDEEPREALQWRRCLGMNEVTFSLCDVVFVNAIAYLSYQTIFPRQKKLRFIMMDDFKDSISEDVMRILKENHDNVEVTHCDPAYY